MSIGERIATLRKEHDISQGQLASLLDVSRQAVSKWENDSSSPDTLRLIQLADVLDTDVEYLATGKKPEPKIQRIYVNVPEIREKIVEKPVEKKVIQYIEKPVYVEKPVVQTVEKVVEKPVVKLKRVIRYRYLRNPLELFLLGVGCFVLGVLVGIFML